MKRISCVNDAKAACGEGLLWDAHRACLWWIDIAKEMLHRYDVATGPAKPIQMPYLISALAHGQDAQLLIATAQGIGQLDPATGDIRILHNPEPDQPDNRLNDLIAGPDGSLWAGTMNEGARAPTGTLYRYDVDGCTAIMRDTTLSNGMDWSPDLQRLYFIDSEPGVLHVRENGVWRVLFIFDETTGKPDGMSVDSAGTQWIAICDQGRVIAMSPQGEIIDSIALPCQIVTNCAFGGPDLKTLFVTSGDYSLSDAEKAASPRAGGLFAIEMDVAGRASFTADWPRI